MVSLLPVVVCSPASTRASEVGRETAQGTEWSKRLGLVRVEERMPFGTRGEWERIQCAPAVRHER
ncbi:hypothetical protein Pyn_31605 [Prunus yedoensis var. nudiflora]|uniref:Uncharacterized protein n=1 Tax=Prunus yedoensis var. nudiflora TaxID=2094558 RepID=A0A314ZJQ7_PRUYE|nr:hypothetical protein Pyn_31605 [Prunus yedoensis var. nudiflora]